MSDWWCTQDTAYEDGLQEHTYPTIVSLFRLDVLVILGAASRTTQATIFEISFMQISKRGMPVEPLEREGDDGWVRGQRPEFWSRNE